MTSRSANTAPESSHFIVKSTLHRPHSTRVPSRDDPSPSKTYTDVSTPTSSNKTMTVKQTAIVRVSYTVNRGMVVRRLLPSLLVEAWLRCHLALYWQRDGREATYPSVCGGSVMLRYNPTRTRPAMSTRLHIFVQHTPVFLGTRQNVTLAMD